MRHSSTASSAVTCDSRASQYFIAGFLEVYRSSNRFLRCFTLPVEAVVGNAGFHVVAAKPHGTATPKRRISTGEHNLFVAAHAQNFVWLDQRAAGQLL